MGAEIILLNRPEWNRWKPASGHMGGWRVIRYRDGPGLRMDEFNKRDETVWLCRKYETAKAMADRLNRRPDLIEPCKWGCRLV